MDVVVPASLQPQQHMPEPAARRPGTMQFHVADENGDVSTIDEQSLMDDAQKLGYQVVGHADDGMSMTLKHGEHEPLQVPMADFIGRMGYQVKGAAPRHANYDHVDPKLTELAALPGLDDAHKEDLIRGELKRRGDENPSLTRGPGGEFYRFDPKTRQYHSLTHSAPGSIGLDDAERVAMGAPHFLGAMAGGTGGTAVGAAGGLPGMAAGGAAGSMLGGQAGDALVGGGAAALDSEIAKAYQHQGVGGIAEEQAPGAVADAIGGAGQGALTRFLPGLVRSGAASTVAKAGGRTAELGGELAQNVGGYVSRAGKAAATGGGTLPQQLAAQGLAQAAGGVPAAAGLAADVLRAPAQLARGVPKVAGWIGRGLEDIAPGISKRLTGFAGRYGGKSLGEMGEEFAAGRAAARLRARPMTSEVYPDAFENATTTRGLVRQALEEEARQAPAGAAVPHAADEAERAFHDILANDVARQHAKELPSFLAEENAKVEPFTKLLTRAESAANTIDRGIYGGIGMAGGAVEKGGALAKYLGRGARGLGEITDSIETPVEIQLGRMSEEKRRRRARALQALGIPSNMDAKPVPKTRFAAN